MSEILTGKIKLIFSVIFNIVSIFLLERQLLALLILAKLKFSINFRIRKYRRFSRLLQFTKIYQLEV